MAEQAQNSVLSIPGFEQSDLAAVALFKDSANDFLAAALPEENIAPLAVNGNPYDPQFISVLQNYILNDAFTADSIDLQALRAQYYGLSETSVQLIDNYAALQAAPSSDAKSNVAKGDEIVSRFQRIIGKSLTNTEPSYSPQDDEYYVDVDGATTHALTEELSKLKNLNPDIDTDDFNPYVLNDGKAHDFLNRLVAKNMDAANVKPDNVQMTLVHLWAIQQNNCDTDCSKGMSFEEENLANSSAMRDLVGMISSGKLPNGGGVNVSFDNSYNTATYNGAMTSDRFFSSETYASMIDKNEVSAAVLFKDDGNENPHLEDLKLAAKALNINTESGVVNQEQLGQIAGLMLEYHACKLGIDKNDITAAINDGRFMPDLDDLRLVEVGLGMPSRLSSPNFSGSESMAREMYNRDEVNALRTAKWEGNFGSLPESVMQQQMKLYDCDALGEDSVREYIRDNKTLPSVSFSSPRAITGTVAPTQYEIKRSEYLRENAEKLKPCISEVRSEASDTRSASNTQGTSSQFADAARGNAGVEEDFELAARDATGNDAGAIPSDGITPETPETAPELSRGMTATS